MACLFRSRHALDTYLARGRVITMTAGGLNTGSARLVVTIAVPTAEPRVMTRLIRFVLADDALIARATRASYAAWGLREQVRDRSGAGWGRSPPRPHQVRGGGYDR